MPYQYGEPVRGEDGVLFRVNDHGEASYLFKVSRTALEHLSSIDPESKNPLDYVNRGYTAQLPHPFADADNRMDSVDIYNKYRDVIHKAAVSLLEMKAAGDPIAISGELLEREYRGNESPL